MMSSQRKHIKKYEKEVELNQVDLFKIYKTLKYGPGLAHRQDFWDKIVIFGLMVQGSFYVYDVD